MKTNCTFPTYMYGTVFQLLNSLSLVGCSVSVGSLGPRLTASVCLLLVSLTLLAQSFPYFFTRFSEVCLMFDFGSLHLFQSIAG